MNELSGTSKANTLRDRLRARFGKSVGGAEALLLDVSASMIGAPIERLREVADKFRGHRRFTFSDDVRELGPTESVGDTQCSTKMDRAFEHVKSFGIHHIVVVTDGDPDDEDAALEAAEGLRIDILYVGPMPAPAFLDKLARHTGGQYGEASLMNKEIENKIAGLIEAPKSSIQL